MSRCRTILTSLAFLAGLSQAQSQTRPLEFEVASIKPSNPTARGSSIMTDRTGGLTATNVPLRNIITSAYGLRDFQLTGGPGWVGTDRYDIVAKPSRSENTPAAAPMDLPDDQRKISEDQWKERIRSLLTDRFGLVVHKETKEQQIYVLTVAKGGSKLKAVPTPGPGKNQGMRSDRGRSQGMAAPMWMLANTLSSNTGRPVVDKTGLTEKYDFTLEWTPDVAAAENPDSASSGSGPTIFTAVQEQLGLKLESTKGPVDIYVIDKVDRPSAN